MCRRDCSSGARCRCALLTDHLASRRRSGRSHTPLAKAWPAYTDQRRGHHPSKVLQQWTTASTHPWADARVSDQLKDADAGVSSQAQRPACTNQGSGHHSLEFEVLQQQVKVSSHPSADARLSSQLAGCNCREMFQVSPKHGSETYPNQQRPPAWPLPAVAGAKLLHQARHTAVPDCSR